MPKLVVGFSQKVGEPNYGSRGANVVLELEVDSPTASNRGPRAGAIARIVSHRATDRDRRVARPSADPHDVGPSPLTNGHAPPSPPRIPPRPATPNQIRAIVGLAIRYQVNLTDLLQQRFRVNRAEDLSLYEASALIDELKSSQAMPLDG